jgi:hypothetical protein
MLHHDPEKIADLLGIRHKSSPPVVKLIERHAGKLLLGVLLAGLAAGLLR